MDFIPTVLIHLKTNTLRLLAIERLLADPYLPNQLPDWNHPASACFNTATICSTERRDPIREDLRQWRGPERMVWGLKDTFFGVEWATG
jgi:hypothetical protein